MGVALHLRATPSRRLVQRDHLVAEYWYLCRRAARRFMRRGLDRGDLEQTGAIGLIKAADRFDPSHRAPFEAYAWLLIVGELMHYVRDSERPLRAPRAIRELERRWSAAEHELSARLGREASERDVVELARFTPQEASEVRRYRATSRLVSVDAAAGLPLQAPHGVESLLDRLAVRSMLDALPPLERRIVAAIHLYGATVVEVASRLGYSRRHVTRLHRAALERLKLRSEVAPRSCAEAKCDVPVSHRR